MKTWKKIEETKKRTNEISNLKKRNEEKVQKVSWWSEINGICVESDRHSVKLRKREDELIIELYCSEVETGRKEKNIRSYFLIEAGRS